MGKNEYSYTIYLGVSSIFKAKQKLLKNIIVNRPSVAGAVLLSSPSLTKGRGKEKLNL